MRILMLICMALFLGNTSLSAQTAEYVGAKKCKMCHNKPATGAQYAKWADSKHAHAMESLNAEEAKDPKCLKCHSTYGSVDKDLITSLTLAEGVSCESCHGAGSLYWPMSVMKDKDKAIAKGLMVPTEKTCVACHNSESPNFKGFNYKDYLAKIAHPNPAS